MNKAHKIIFSILALVAALAVAFLVFAYGKTKPRVPAAVPSNALIAKVTKVPLDQLPKYFPASVFMEPDAKMIENSNTEFDDGRVWGTRTYESSRPANKIRDDYQNYLRSLAGWTVSKVYYRENQTFLAAAKENKSLIVVIIGGVGMTANSVTISYQIRK